MTLPYGLALRYGSLMAQPQVIGKTPRWWVVSKPSGMLTVPGRGNYPVLSEWARKELGPVWVVHRLDRETSGVVLLARTENDHREACGWFQERKTKKVYTCLASGLPNAPIIKVNSPIEGAPSISQIEVRETYREGFLARVVPRTGRRHQIRIHLSRSGYPLWGDVLYGGASEIQFAKDLKIAISRVALHASSLELPTGEKFESELSDDFRTWLDVLRKEGQNA